MRYDMKITGTLPVSTKKPIPSSTLENAFIRILNYIIDNHFRCHALRLRYHGLAADFYDDALSLFPVPVHRYYLLHPDERLNKSILFFHERYDYSAADAIETD